MHLTLVVLLLLGGTSLAAKWAIDGSCDLVRIADPGNGLDPYLQATEPLKEAMKEAITMAKNALKVMGEHTADQHASAMLKLVLGEDTEYQSRFDAFKKNFENILVYDQEPAADRPMDQKWQDTMTNDDLMIFCSKDRFKQLNPANKFYYDTSMKNTVYVQGNVESGSVRGDCLSTAYDINNLAAGGKTQAFTTDSDNYDRAAYQAAPSPKSLRNFRVERQNIAFSIDFCTWFLHRQLHEGWPSINKDRITQTQQPGFKGGITEYATPIDGLRNVGLSMLHELTHTRPGGRLRDVPKDDLPPGTPSCYGWKCIQDLKDPTNGDNVAMLGLALHLWTMGYYVDKDGNVNDR